MLAKRFAVCVTLVLLTGCMKEPKPTADDSAIQVQQLIDRWTKAFQAKDLDGVMAYYVPGDRLVGYDIVPPLQYKGADAYRKNYAEFFKQFKGPIHVQERDVDIEAGSDIAFAHGLERLTGTSADGKPVDSWIRWTSGYRKIGGRWYALHDHVSVPVDLATGKALLDLKP
jgi:ketosteroid isomerase-like protein